MDANEKKEFKENLKSKLTDVQQQIKRDLQRSKSDQKVNSIEYDGQDYICRFEAKLQHKKKNKSGVDKEISTEYNWENWTQAFSSLDEMMKYIKAFFDDFDSIVASMK
ncbi:MAG: hypothetical protein PVH88_02110 [Ignavibacteria bacterium]|jgi:hypothetical protein